MRILNYLLLSLLLSIISTNIVYSVPAYPFPIKITQADGSEISILLHGDEFFNYKTTVDGYLLKKNSNNILTYARVNNNGNIECTTVKANDVKNRLKDEKIFVSKLSKDFNFSKQYTLKRQLKAPTTRSNLKKQNSFPITGNGKSIIILVNFSDKNFVTATPQQSFTNLLNQEGYSTNGGTGSARDYFMASSYGKFAPTFDVFGPVTLPQNLDYYGINDGNGDDTNPVQMIVDACTKANDAGLNFAQYDTDSDGILDNVFIYYAGYNEAEHGPDNTIWPHRWGVYPGSNYSGNINSVTFDGKRLNDYACTSELRGSSGSNMCGIGTFCHEFGHVLGLVDYYHTTDSKKTLESWSIMDGGAYNNLGRTPPTYSTYDRFFLGYLTPKEIYSPANLTLLPIGQTTTVPSNTNNQAFLFAESSHNLIGSNPNPKEFFMVEYRKKIGWDAFLPSEGMLVWHIDYDQNAWDNNEPNNYTGTNQTAASHMRVYIQPLIGSSTTPGTAFTSGSYTPISWAGVNISKPITEIQKTTTNVTFKFMGGDVKIIPPVATDATEIKFSSFIANWESVDFATGYYLSLYKITDKPQTIKEGFDKSLTPPLNWKISAKNVSTSNLYAGIKTPAIEFRTTGESVETESFIVSATELSFYIRSIGENSGFLLVEGQNALNQWITIDNIQIVTEPQNFDVAKRIKKYAFGTTENYTCFKFTFTKGTASLAFDDVELKFAREVSNIETNKWTDALTDTLFNLAPTTEYVYRVKSSDKTVNNIFENITSFSNSIVVKTSDYPVSKGLVVKPDDNGDLNISLPSMDITLEIFNILGQKIKTISNPTMNPLKIDNLLPHQLYIVRINDRKAKIIPNSIK